jgi:hypothetical protein
LISLFKTWYVSFACPVAGEEGFAITAWKPHGAACPLARRTPPRRGRGGRPGDTESTVKTGGLDDFWFEGAEVGLHSLDIVAERLPEESFPTVSRQRDVTLGDVPLRMGGRTDKMEAKLQRGTTMGPVNRSQEGSEVWLLVTD